MREGDRGRVRERERERERENKPDNSNKYKHGQVLLNLQFFESGGMHHKPFTAVLDNVTM
jgi:hypothetical protein